MKTGIDKRVMAIGDSKADIYINRVQFSVLGIQPLERQMLHDRYLHQDYDSNCSNG